MNVFDDPSFAGTLYTDWAINIWNNHGNAVTLTEKMQAFEDWLLKHNLFLLHKGRKRYINGLERDLIVFLLKEPWTVKSDA